jgi:hypothetical protein
MANKREFFYVVNIKNGGVYLLDQAKIESEPGEWKTYIKPTEEVVEEEDTEGNVGDELTYKELKSLLTASEVDFKGNASKEELTKLFEDTL